MNDPAAAGDLARIEITNAYPGGSDDIPTSRDRVAGFTEELRSRGVTIVDSVEAVLENSDAILLESVDGRVHLDQFRKLAAGKPIFVDKPAAASLADVIEIFRIAEETKTPCFSSSALRFSDNIVALNNDESLGRILGCSVASPFEPEPHHPDLFWYGVHGVESIYTLMGTGCDSVSRIDGVHETVVTGKWADGRIAIYHGLKNRSDYLFTALGSNGARTERNFSGYEPLVHQICKFFLTAKPPVSPEETIEMFAFMEAADESLRREGRPVSIGEIIAAARSKNKGKP
jgi:hypothetical protein